MLKKTIFLSFVGAGMALGACTVEEPCPIVDREAIAWDKYGEPTEFTAALECSPRPKPRPAYVLPVGTADRINELVRESIPEDKPDEPNEPNEPNETVGGNPGNDKSVGRSGEKVEEGGFAEQGEVGNRGKSN